MVIVITTFKLSVVFDTFIITYTRKTFSQSDSNIQPYHDVLPVSKKTTFTSVHYMLYGNVYGNVYGSVK